VRAVAALYCLPDSVYRSIPGVDVWDKARDATLFLSGSPVVAHPPCAQWSRLRTFSKQDHFEKCCGLIAVDQVRRLGGVLEHPAGSALWSAAGLPPPGYRDNYGGWTLPISQRWWGHPCEKKTLLYIVGVEPADIPDIPLDLSYPKTSVSRQHSGTRSKTPLALAVWLVELARRAH